MGFFSLSLRCNQKQAIMKTIDFENTKMILKAFTSMSCRTSIADRFDKNGLITLNLRETKTMLINITNDDMGLIAFFYITKNTYIKLLKNKIL